MRHPVLRAVFAGAAAHRGSGLFRVAAATLSAAAALLGCSTPVTPSSAVASAPSSAPPTTAPAAPGVADARPEVPLRLMVFNDFHGHLEPGTLKLDLADTAHPGQTLKVPVGGAAALAGLVNELRAGSAHSLLLSGGDLIGGTPLVSSLFRHESTLAVARELKVDAGVVGNHEFDAGWDELQRVIRGGCAAAVPGQPAQSCAEDTYPALPFPLLGGNVRLRATGQPALAPYTIKTVDGVRLGIIGAVTRSTADIVLRSGIAALAFDDEVQAINAASRALQAQGVQAQVLLIHEGGEIGAAGQRADWNDETCPGAKGPVFDIARQLEPAVQIVFSAHSHQGYRCKLALPGGERWVLQATSFGRGLAVADVRLDRRSGTLISGLTQTQNLPVLNASTPAPVREQVLAQVPAPWRFALQLAQPDRAVATLVGRYAQRAAPLTEQPVGRLAGPIKRAAEGRADPAAPVPTDSPAGRWLADAHLAATRAPEAGGAELALMNSGGIRSDLDCEPAPCTVRYGQVITQQPFGNALITQTLTGEQLRRLLESQQRGAQDAPAFLQPSASLRYTWVASAPAGQHVQDLRINGQPVQPQQRIRVAANGFLADGGDGFAVLREGSQRVTGPLDAEAVLQVLAPSLNGPLSPGPEAAPRIRWQP